MYIGEPGQHRRLSARGRSELSARLEQLEKMQKLYPLDEKLAEEIRQIRDRLEEADRADAASAGDPMESTRGKLENARRRLEQLEEEMQSAGGERDLRREVEAEQLKRLIEQLEKEVESGADRQLPEGGRRRREDDAMTKEAKEMAREMAQDGFKRMMEQLKVNPQELGVYHRYVESVKQEIRDLRATLDAMEAKKHQRQWIRNKESGRNEYLV